MKPNHNPDYSRLTPRQSQTGSPKTPNPFDAIETLIVVGVILYLLKFFYNI